MFQGPFTAQSKVIRIAVTTSASTSVPLPGRGEAIRVVSEGPNHAFLSIGVGTQTATVPTSTASVTSTPILAGSDNSLSIPDIASQEISAICATGTAVLYVQIGVGM